MEISKRIEERLESIENLLLAQKSVLNLDEVAVYTGLSKSYLYKLTSANMIPHYKPNGKQIYFDKTEIDNWLKQNKRLTREEMEREAADTLNKKRGQKR